ncbi:MAG: hypothetical protein N2557_01365 [Hydrogenophilus sp.]|nr:hypothetical protein [Hydrogenophilus sp.]
MKQPLFLTWVSLLAAGCATPYSEVPIAVNFPTSQQEKLQSAHHWRVIGQSIAARLSHAIAADQGCRAAPMICPTVAVATSDRPSSFERALVHTITTELVTQGWKVQTEIPAEIVIRLDIHAQRFTSRPPDGKFTSWALLAGGLVALSDNPEIGIWHHFSPGAAVLTGLAAADIWRIQTSQFASGAIPEIEVMVSASAVRDGVYLARTTDIYYLATDDLALYQPPPSPPLPPAVLPVKGS